MGDLIISEHVVNENVAKLESKDFLNKTFVTCIDCMKIFLTLRDTKSSDPGAYDELLLPDTDVLLQFAEHSFSLISVINNVLNCSLETMDRLDAILNVVLDEDNVDEKTQEELHNIALDGISYMSTFIFYEFLNTPGYDEIVVSYCGKHSIDIDTFIKEYATIYKQYRRSLGVFNDYPELEQPFIEIVGPALSLIPEDALTKEDVVGIISGNMPLEALMEKLGISENDDEREDEGLGSSSNIF